MEFNEVLVGKQSLSLKQHGEMYMVKKFFTLKRKFYEISLMITPSKANAERGFSVLFILSIKLQNALVLNSLKKLMQLFSLELHIDDINCGKITDLDKFSKKSHSQVPS